MTDKAKTQTDESRNTIESLKIEDLRKWAGLMGISFQRDWTVEDFVKAIKAQQEAAKYVQPSSGSDLPPGHASILIHKDPSPNHSNSAVPLGVNGRMLRAPRGVKVTVPIEYVEVLANARTTIIAQKKEPDKDNPQGIVVEETLQNYPFQVFEVRPHDENSRFRTSEFDQRSAMYERKIKFVKEIGKWPTLGELLEFEKEMRKAAK